MSLDLQENSLVAEAFLVNLSLLQHLNLRSNQVINGDLLVDSPVQHSLKTVNLRNNFTFSNRNLIEFEILESIDVRNNKRIDREWFKTYKPQIKLIC